MKRLRGRGKRFHSWSKSQAVAFNRCFTFFHSSFIDGSIAPSTAVGLAPFAGRLRARAKLRRRESFRPAARRLKLRARIVSGSKAGKYSQSLFLLPPTMKDAFS